MKKTGKIALLVGAMAAIVAVLFLASQPSEPVYQGKHLSQWLWEFDMSNSLLEPDRRRKAEEAIREMGTNAVPFLVRELRVRDSRLKYDPARRKFRPSQKDATGEQVSALKRIIPEERIYNGRTFAQKVELEIRR